MSWFKNLFKPKPLQPGLFTFERRGTTYTIYIDAPDQRLAYQRESERGSGDLYLRSLIRDGLAARLAVDVRYCRLASIGSTTFASESSFGWAFVPIGRHVIGAQLSFRRVYGGGNDSVTLGLATNPDDTELAFKAEDEVRLMWKTTINEQAFGEVSLTVDEFHSEINNLVKRNLGHYESAGECQLFNEATGRPRGPLRVRWYLEPVERQDRLFLALPGER